MSQQLAMALHLHRRLKHLSNDQKYRVIDRVIDDVESLEVFVPLHECGSDEDKLNEFADSFIDRDALIREKQFEYGIDSDAPPMFEEIETDEFGRTKMHRAVAKGDAEAVRALIEEGEDVNIKDHAGHTPLHLAVFNEYIEVIAVFREANLL